MHMADALINPSVGGTMLAVTGGLIFWSSRSLQKDKDHSRVSLMGVLGAFVFAAQMVNFTIPGTGSSGHISGGLLLAMLLGPPAGFIAICSILLIQALFFADGGLLAYGSNCFNLGFIPCFVVYPMFFRRTSFARINPTVLTIKTVTAGVIALQLGAFAVVLETWLSGIAALSLTGFLLLMQPIHLVIGLIEGLITAGVAVTIWKTRPDIMYQNSDSVIGKSLKPILVAFTVFALATGTGLSWFASTHPDGLEWSVTKVSGSETGANNKSQVKSRSILQESTALMPDYDFKTAGQSAAKEATNTESTAWPTVNAGTSFSGLIGSGMTLILILLLTLPLKYFRRKTPSAT